MDKNFETLLKYQEIDIKLKRLLDSLEKSDANKKMEQARAEFNIAKKTVLDSEKEAEGVISVYETLSSQITELNEKNKELELIVENVDADELVGFADQIETVKDNVVALEKRLSEIKAMAEKLIKTFQDANTMGLKMKDYFNSAKADYSELVKNAEPEISAYKKKLKELEPEINEELFAKYKAITSDNKYPAFVEVYDGDGVYSCTGCGLQLSQKNTSELNEKGICTCETCRRTIFKR
ncbi:MAG: hypothetical protein IKC35_02950 [Clostridia bacterium]|nr:hypothetical protein [Clostridia bacterium]